MITSESRPSKMGHFLLPVRDNTAQLTKTPKTSKQFAPSFLRPTRHQPAQNPNFCGRAAAQRRNFISALTLHGKPDSSESFSPQLWHIDHRRSWEALWFQLLPAEWWISAPVSFGTWTPKFFTNQDKSFLASAFSYQVAQCTIIIPFSREREQPVAIGMAPLLRRDFVVICMHARR